MAVYERQIIDLVTVDPVEGVASLVMVEHRLWGESGALLPDLQEKLNTYLCFVLDGRLHAEFPATAGLSVCFDLLCAYPPTERELAFLVIVEREDLTPNGIRMTWQLLAASKPVS